LSIIQLQHELFLQNTSIVTFKELTSWFDPCPKQETQKATVSFSKRSR